MKSTKWMINLGIVLALAALIGIIFSATDAAGPLTTSANTPRQEFDFGDAPDRPYPTLLNSGGAHHQIVEGIHLGDFIDGEVDGWPDAAALGDDLDQDPDDEDGGLFSSPLFAGQTASLDVVASTEGMLDAWLDFDGNGNWADPGEQIFLAQPLQPGPNNLTFIVPRDAATGLTFSRLRFSLEGRLPFEGPAPEGEVEDYRVDIQIPSPEPGWAKWVNDEPWSPDLLVGVETSQTITVTDVITTFAEFRLHEDWNPTHLTLRDYAVTAGSVERGEDSLEWFGVAPPSGVVTLTKWFHVKPCTWDATILNEFLEVPIVPFPERPVAIEKEAPILGIGAEYDPEVVAGLPVTFTLIYSNTGGNEVGVTVRNDFPPDAPFAGSDPPPDDSDPAGTFAMWNIGELGRDSLGMITVTVDITPTLEPSSTVVITDYIYDHTGEVADLVEIPFHVEEPHKAEWEKLVNDQLWDPELTVTVQTSQTFTVTDIIRTHRKARFILLETWNPDHLTLRDAYVDPPEASHLIPGPGSLEWHVGVDHAEAITLTKVFHVEPCNWPDTVLFEELVGLKVPEPVRPVTFNKMPPILWIDVADYNREVAAGDLVSFTLLYGNDGGYENDVMIRNNFPLDAPFVSSEPAPDREGPDGLWVEWDVGNLEMEQQDRISVTVAISSLLQPSTTVTIVDYIYDHMGERVDWVEIPFHVARPPVGEWKKQVNGRTWVPDMAVTVQTSQTITVTDIITTHPGVPFRLAETWNPEHLTLRDAYVDPPEAPQPISEPGFLDWRVEPDHAEVLTLTKVFHVEPCNWPRTILEEALEGLTVPEPVRPVVFNKMPPILWIDVAEYNPEVAAADLVSFTLLYGNDGGYENDVMIRNVFPDGAPFVSSEPAPDRKDPDGLWVEWDVGNLEMDQQDRISVTVAIDPLLQPTTTVTIVDYIYDHMEERVDLVEIPFHVARPPRGEWKKQVNRRTWVPDMAVTVQTSQTITVTDVITTHPGAPFRLAETWNPEHLTLLRAYVDPPEAPQPLSEPGSLDWRVEPDHAEVLTLTKVFHVEPCNWTRTILEETLEGLTVPDPVRPVIFNKMPPNLWIGVAAYDPEVSAADLVSFTLLYGNDGGFENDVMIRNDFPPGAPFVSSEPAPDREGPDGLWVEWDVGNLAMQQGGRITVTAAISPLLQPTTTVTIVDYIYDHMEERVDWVEIPFHVARPPAAEWKKQVDDLLWAPGMTSKVQPSQTITITDVITTHPGAPFRLTETWNPEHLTLRDAYVEPPEASHLIPGSGSLDWRVDPDHAEVLTLTKVFHVEPGNWGITVLREVLEGLNVTNPAREVTFRTSFYLFLPVIARNYIPTALDGATSPMVPRMIPVVTPTLVGERLDQAEAPARPPTRFNRRRTIPR